jgi:drug/metabolite transporter (DMT)-like permease
MSNGLLIALAITGLLATALAFTVQTWAQRYTTPTRTAVIYSLEPVFAWVFSWMLTGELLSRRATAGAGLILAGILVVELKRSEAGQHHRIEVSAPEV